MKLIINVSSIFKGGAEQVALSFINECLKHSENTYYVFLCDNISEQLDLNLFPSNFKFYHLKNRPGSGVINLLKALYRFDRLEREIMPDCVISTGGHGYWKPKAPLVCGFNIPHFIYSDSPYFKNMKIWKRIFWYLKKKIHLFFYKRADAFIVQTDDVKKRLSKITNEIPIYTIYNTVYACFIDPSNFPDKLSKREGDEIRLLTLSSYYPHKNLEIIKDVVDELLKNGETRFRFILTLPDSLFSKKFRSRNPYIQNVGPLPIRECPSLYKECDFMFLPTLLECFSASYAEAMMMGKPILTSNLGFARTVCGNAAVYFDPLNPKDIRENLLEIVLKSEKVQELQMAGKKRINIFDTPETRAEKFLKICRKLTENGSQ